MERRSRRTPVKPLKAAALIAGPAALAGYLALIRPRLLTWGASEDEVQRPMPGDDLIAPPLGLNVTRAITIEAPAGAVWPWLVQMGYRRGGWYSYDRLDNGGVPSADRIVPELQQLAPGDEVPVGPPDGIRIGGLQLVGPDDGFRVAAIERDRLLLLTSHGWGPMRRDTLVSTWCYVLDAIDATRTRFVERIRATGGDGPMDAALAPVIELGEFLMMHRQLVRLKARVERVWAG
jgi:hypothetical protein